MKIKTNHLFCLATILLVFLFFAHTLNYPWRHFDENIIYNETVYPVAKTFAQIFEYIHFFGLNHHFEASNPFYSEISNLRCDPLNTLITLFVYYFFQKSAFTYHSFILIMHLLNTFLLFFILNKISLNFTEHNSNTSEKVRLFTVSVLTGTWALNPVNIESVLFTANWAAILSYFLCLLIMFYFIEFNLKKDLLINSIILFFLYLIPIFNTEYSITLPLILFFYSFAVNQRNSSKPSLFQSFSFALKKTLPMFLALSIFVIHFISSPTKENIHNAVTNSLQLTLERIFWLSPQIFFHYIKLILLPIHLSIDQTGLVRFSNLLINPYSIFCTIFMYVFILLLFLSFLSLKKKSSYYFFISFSFYFVALLPFLHLISPSYCIASERYLYFPTLMLIFGVSHFLFFLISNKSFGEIKVPIIVFITVVFCTLSTRAYVRTLDWKDSISLFSSALKESPNDLFKAIRLEFLGSILSELSTDDLSKQRGINHMNEAITTLQKSIVSLEGEKQKYEEGLPQIIKYYGLDPKTIQAKSAYLLAFTELGLNRDASSALKILEPYMQDLSVIDTQILDLYLGLLFGIGRFDEAEKILNYAINIKLSPTVLIAFSELYIHKYNDLSTAEKYLKKSFKYFPYDQQTLFYLRQFYFHTKKPNEFALFSYLHGIRTHSKESLQDAYQVFTYLNNKIMADKVLENIKLLSKKA